MSRADLAAARKLAAELQQDHPEGHQFRVVRERDPDNGEWYYAIERKRECSKTWYWQGDAADVKTNANGVHFLYGERLR